MGSAVLEGPRTPRRAAVPQPRPARPVRPGAPPLAGAAVGRERPGGLVSAPPGREGARQPGLCRVTHAHADPGMSLWVPRAAVTPPGAGGIQPTLLPAAPGARGLVSAGGAPGCGSEPRAVPRDGDAPVLILPAGRDTNKPRRSCGRGAEGSAEPNTRWTRMSNHRARAVPARGHTGTAVPAAPSEGHSELRAISTLNPRRGYGKEPLGTAGRGDRRLRSLPARGAAPGGPSGRAGLSLAPPALPCVPSPRGAFVLPPRWDFVAEAPFGLRLSSLQMIIIVIT